MTIDIKPIKTDADYRATLKEIESLMMVETDVPKGERLDGPVTPETPLIAAFVLNFFFEAMNCCRGELVDTGALHLCIPEHIAV